MLIIRTVTAEHDEMHDMEVLSDGGYILAGTTRGPGTVDYDYWVLKLDSNFNQVWNKSYGYVGDNIFEYFTGVEELSDGGFIASGWGNRPDGFGNFDAVLYKLNSTGDLVWNLSYGTSNDDRFYDVKVRDGMYYVSGRYSGTDGLLGAFSSSGSLLWNQTYDFGGSEYLYKLHFTNDDTIIAAGTVSQNNVDHLVVTTNLTGSLIWNQTYGNIGADTFGRFNDFGEEGYALVGSTRVEVSSDDSIFFTIIGSAAGATFNSTIVSYPMTLYNVSNGSLGTIFNSTTNWTHNATMWANITLEINQTGDHYYQVNCTTPYASNVSIVRTLNIGGLPAPENTTVNQTSDGSINVTFGNVDSAAGYKVWV